MQLGYENQEIAHTVVVQELFTNATVATMQHPYLLTETEYYHLRRGPPHAEAWSMHVFAAVLGFAVGLGPKLVGVIRGEPASLTPAEMWTVGGGVAVAVAIRVLGHYLPNERRDTFARIAAHFKKATPTHHIVGGQKQ